MEKFMLAVSVLSPEKKAALIEDAMRLGYENAEELINQQLEDSKECYLNSMYTVLVFNRDKLFCHLSIRRNDRQPIHDWRDLQQIKNILVGEEYEAAELYPAEERLVDTANQYHLWVCTDATYRFPFGFKQGLVDYNPSPETGAKQREI